MQKKYIIIFLILLGVALAVIPYIFKKEEIKKPIISESNSVSEFKVININIENFNFEPTEINIKKGDTVVWKENDSVPHTVTVVGKENVPNSEILNQGETYSFTFNEVGTFIYRCKIHPSMKGVIKVTQ